MRLETWVWMISLIIGGQILTMAYIMLAFGGFCWSFGPIVIGFAILFEGAWLPYVVGKRKWEIEKNKEV